MLRLNICRLHVIHLREICVQGSVQRLGTAAVGSFKKCQPTTVAQPIADAQVIENAEGCTLVG